jgi:diguanylate cyclase (GGDEF)-like protein
VSSSILRTTDFASYRELLGALLPESFSIALTNTRGETWWCDDGFPEPVLTEAIPSEVLEHDDAGETMVVPVPGLAARGTAFVAPIAVEGHGVLALIWAAGPRRDVTGVKWLATIADHMSKELSLNQELDAMATELTERYEELNLVYHTADDVGYFAEGQEALQQLVKNCREYLDVEFAFLIMKEKGIEICHHANDQDSHDAKILLDRVGADVYQMIMKSGEPVIINEVDSTEACELWQGLAYRLLATPVLDNKDHCDGVLAIAARFGAQRFSNSDKNLIQVMARKTAKILQVNYDALTGLVNREGLEYTADQLLQDVHSHGSTHCVLHIDIDQLHVINDTISHDAGDALIQAIARQLHHATRDTDLLARIGGDELGLLLRKCPLDRGTEIAEKLRECIVNLVVPWSGRSLTATVSIGIAPIDEDTKTAAAALAAAELACDTAKEMGNNRVQRFFHSDSGLIKRHREMEAVGRIQTALKADQFLLYGQLIEPLNSSASGMHLEVLVRMAGDDGSVISPAEFLPAAERYHLMPDVDRWVIRHAFRFIDEHWNKLADQLSLISINVSGQTLNEPEFALFLVEKLREISAPPERICFEITESVAAANLEEAIQFMTTIREQGCKFALDDFGSGVSSFQYLRTLPVDFLKIDGSLIVEVAEDEIAASMVAAIQQVASVMNLQTIAEYVKSDAIKEKLRELRVDYAQGFTIAKPKALVEHFVDIDVGLRTESA